MERIENYPKQKKKGKSEESFSFFFSSSSFVPSQFGICFLQYYLFDLFVCLFLLILWIIYRWMNLSIERYYLKNVQTNTTVGKVFFLLFFFLLILFIYYLINESNIWISTRWNWFVDETDLKLSGYSFVYL